MGRWRHHYSHSLYSRLKYLTIVMAPIPTEYVEVNLVFELVIKPLLLMTSWNMASQQNN